MRLITRFELASRSTPGLRNLLCEAFNALARSAPDSTDRLHALANIENVQAELIYRANYPS